MRVQDFDGGEPYTPALRKALPGPTAALAPPPKLAQPHPQHVFPKGPQSPPVTRNGMVLKGSAHHPPQPLRRVPDRPVPAPPQLAPDFPELGGQALADGYPSHSEPARLGACPTNVSETQKIAKVSRFPSPRLFRL